MSHHDATITSCNQLSLATAPAGRAYNPDHRYDQAERYAQGGILLLVESIQDVTRYGNSLAAELVGLLPPQELPEEQDA